MKRSLIIGLVPPVLGLVALAQAPPAQLQSPTQVVGEYMKLEAEGGRLTTEGWYKAGAFFVQPPTLPQNKKIEVIGGDYSVSQKPLVVKGDTATVTVDIEDEAGLDSNLSLVQPIAGTIKSGLAFNLVLTNKYWELGDDGKLKQVIGPPQWKIADAWTTVWISVDTAIRYVTDMRSRTTDPIVKKNADKTIASLLPFKNKE